MHCKDSQNNRNTQRSIQNKMPYSFAKLLIEEERVHGKKIINLLECIQKSMNGRVVVPVQWDCSHTPATVRFGYERQHWSLTMDFGSVKLQLATFPLKML